MKQAKYKGTELQIGGILENFHIQSIALKSMSALLTPQTCKTYSYY